MTNEKTEQRVNLKFLVKLKKTSPMECIKLLKGVYGDNLMSRSRVPNCVEVVESLEEQHRDAASGQCPFGQEVSS